LRVHDGIDGVVIHTVSLADVMPQPWRNGGGATQELLAWPATDNWQVRISVARIEQNGPFSAYPGIERWFTVVHGEGVTLRFADTAIVQHADTQPVRFKGEASPECELLNGATQDLNLMVRRADGDGAMRLVAAELPWISAAALRAAYTAQPAVLVVADRHETVLPANTLAWSHEAAHQRWHLTGGKAGTLLRAWWLAYSG
jgi:uncharacterized protein